MDVELRHFVLNVFILTWTLIVGCDARQERKGPRIDQSSVHDRDGKLSSDEIDVICALIQAIADDHFVFSGARFELKHLSLDAIGGKNAIDRWLEDDRQPDDEAIATTLVSRNKNDFSFNADSLREIGTRLGKFGFEMDGRFFTRTLGAATPPSVEIAVAIPGVSPSEGMACTFAGIIIVNSGISFDVWSRIRRSDDGWRCTDLRILGFE